MELFPNVATEDKIEIAKRLKATNKEYKWIEFMDELERAVKKEKFTGDVDPYVWVQLYSHRDCGLFLQVIAARIPEEESNLFLSLHRERAYRLQPHVIRNREKTPLVNATFLKKEGVSPGLRMGQLIREGERLAIMNDLHDPQAIFEQLKKLSVWIET